MHSGELQPQIWFSIFVVVAVVGMALLATLVKKRNDRLREILDRASLPARGAARLTLQQQPRIGHAAPDAASAAAAPDPPTVVTTATLTERNTEVRDRNVAIRRAEERAIDFASRQCRRRHPGPSPEPLPKLDETKPTAPEPKRSTVFIDESLRESILGKSTFEELAHNGAALAVERSSYAVWRPPVAALCACQKQAPGSASNSGLELIQGAGPSVPAGMHDEAVLSRLLESNKPFYGMVIAAGVNLTDGRAVSRDTMWHIQQLVRGLLRDDEFACQIGNNEFLLLCPGRQGAEAQLRLRDISERLWDFQLRSAGNFWILFDTSDLQADNVPLREAVAAASARLQQTCRARKIVTIDSACLRRTASAVV